MRRVLLILFLLAAPLFGQNNQISIAPMVIARQQFLDAAGRPLAYGYVYTYISGGTVPQVTYTDFTGGFQNANPIRLDAGGYAHIWINCVSNFPYRVVVQDMNQVLQWTEDGVQYPACIQGTGSTTPHNLLSETHPDTIPYTPPSIGGMIRGGLLNLWEHVLPSQAGDVWSLVPAGPELIPVWVPPASLDTCTSTQIDGVEIGCEHEINFIQGTNITMTGTDDSDNDRTNITINAAGGGSLTCDPNTTVDIYVDTAGSDVTGDGTLGNPYETIQHAIDVGVPIFVGAKYVIHLVSAGSYAGFTYASRADCAGGISCTAVPPDMPFPTGLEVIGSTDGVASDTWIITSTITVDGLKMYLQGMMVQVGTFGIIAKNHALLSMAAVHSYNNNLGILGAFFSTLHIQNGVYVNNDFYSVLATADDFNANTDGYEVTEDSVITDSCPDGNNVGLGTTLACETLGTTGKFGLACIEGKKSQLYMRDDVTIDYTGSSASQGKGFQLLDSHAALAIITYLGNGDANSGTGLYLYGSRISGGALGGGNYLISNPNIGMRAELGSEVTDGLTISGAFTSDTLGVAGNQKTATTSIGANGEQSFTYVFNANMTFNAQLAQTHKLTLTGDVTSSGVTNAAAGMTITMELCQDGGGAHAFAWPANFKGADTIGVTASKCNVQRFIYDGVATTWYAAAPMQKDM